MTAISQWIIAEKEQPTERGVYLVCRKDGKIHMEIWNGTGWVDNNNSIKFLAVIMQPDMENADDHKHVMNGLLVTDEGVFKMCRYCDKLY